MPISKTRLAVAGVACAAAVATAAALAGSAAGSSDRAAAPKVASVIAVTPSTVYAGTTLTVSGKGCTVDDDSTEVDVVLSDAGSDDSDYADAVVGSEDIDEDGAWTVDLDVPDPIDAGRYQVLSTCDQYEDSFSYPAVDVTISPDRATSVRASGPSAVDFGDTGALTGQLLAGGQPVKGAALTLLARPAAAAKFSAVATRTTDKSGKVRLTVRPAVRTAYKWTFAHTTGLRSSVSSPSTVSVARSVDAKAQRSKVSLGSKVVVYGTVAPGTAGLRVQLQQFAKHRWTSVATAQLARQKLPNGARTLGYVTSLTAKQATTYVLRVSVAGGSGLDAGTSPTLRVTARS